jgi:hypothetical protein
LGLDKRRSIVRHGAEAASHPRHFGDAPLDRTAADLLGVCWPALEDGALRVRERDPRRTTKHRFLDRAEMPGARHAKWIIGCPEVASGKGDQPGVGARGASVESDDESGAGLGFEASHHEFVRILKAL